MRAHPESNRAEWFCRPPPIPLRHRPNKNLRNNQIKNNYKRTSVFTSFTTAVHNDHGPDSNRQGTYFHRFCKLMKYLYSALMICGGRGTRTPKPFYRPTVFKTARLPIITYLQVIAESIGIEPNPGLTERNA